MIKSGKVWGETCAIMQNPLVEFHRITVNAGSRCSTHKHAHKWNGFYVESGILEIHVRKSDYDLTDVTILKAGDFCQVKPGEYHWFVCAESCVAFEIYWPEALSDDIQRLDVGRASADRPAEQIITKISSDDLDSVISKYRSTNPEPPEPTWTTWKQS